MSSCVEEQISRALGSILDRMPDGANIDFESQEFVAVLSGLELFIPATLAQVYRAWAGESIDGFIVRVARKIAPDGAEFIGLAILITDQTVTPIHVRLYLSADRVEISRMECRVGEAGGRKGSMNRLPYGSPKGDKLLERLAAPGAAGEIEWAYSVAFGQMQS